MTTTLRARADEAPGSYTIHANGELVGSLELDVPDRGGCDGWINHVAVDLEHRRKGHGTAAVLAAEEILRRHGCRRCCVRTPPGDGAAPCAAAALGYTERSRNLAKDIPGAPHQPPVGTVVRALTSEEFPAWVTAEKEALVRMRSAQGVTPEEAARQAGETLDALLPEGLATTGTHLRAAVHDGDQVGTLWLHTRTGPADGAGGWVYSVTVLPAHRGQGIGRALMAEAERLCHATGVLTLGLHVMSENIPARRLYRGIGYRTTKINWSKQLA